MPTLSLAQCLGTQDLENEHGQFITIAKLLYTTLAQDSDISTHQLTAEVARALPEFVELGPNKINGWAREYGWNRKI